MPSPRVSAEMSRKGPRRSKVYESFDAPAYCDDMAAYIAQQLALKPKKTSQRASQADTIPPDSWRGDSLQQKSVENLADVSVQTEAVESEEEEEEEEEKVENHANEQDSEEDSSNSLDSEEGSEELDLERTARTKNAAELFLRQLNEQPVEVTETERQLEEQVFSLFAQAQEPTWNDAALQEESKVEPEVAAQIAEMLAAPIKASGPLIEEMSVVSEKEGFSSAEDDNDMDEEDDVDSSTTSAEEDGDVNAIDVLSSDEEEPVQGEFSDAGDDEGILDEAEDEILSHSGHYQASDQDQEVDQMQTQGLYSDMGSDNSASNEAIELLDSDEEEEGEAEDEEESVVGDVPEVYEDERMSALGYGEAEDESDASVLEGRQYSVDEESHWQEDGEEMALEAALEEAADEIIDDVASSVAISQPEKANLFDGNNLFEQPDAVFADFTSFAEASSSAHAFLPSSSRAVDLLHHSFSEPVSPPAVSTSYPSHAQASSSPPQVLHSLEEQSIPPPIVHDLQHTSTAEDLILLKEEIKDKVLDIPPPDSMDVHPGTPDRGVKSDNGRQIDDGHAKTSADLIDIKTIAQKALEGQTSLATSLRSEADSVQRLSDVESVSREAAPQPEVVSEETAVKNQPVEDEDDIGGSEHDDTERAVYPSQPLSETLQEDDHPTVSRSIGDESDGDHLADVVASEASELVEDTKTSAMPNHPLGDTLQEETVPEAARQVRDDSDENDLGGAVASPFLQGKEETIEAVTIDDDGEDLNEGVVEAAPVEPDGEGVGWRSIGTMNSAEEENGNPQETGAISAEIIEQEEGDGDGSELLEAASEETLSKDDHLQPDAATEALEEDVPANPFRVAPEEEKAKLELAPIQTSLDGESHAAADETQDVPSQSESRTKKRRSRHSRHKSDASGDLADFVPEPDVEEEEEEEALGSQRPTKKARAESVVDEERKRDEDAELDVAKVEDEDMLDTSILEESEDDHDGSQMDIDERSVGVGEEELEDKEEEKRDGDEDHDTSKQDIAPEGPASGIRRRKSPRKSNDSAFKLTKVEQSESEEDEESQRQRAKKEGQQEKRRAAERERRKNVREAKRLEKDALKKEEMEAERAVGLRRTRRISEDAKTFKPPAEEEKVEPVVKDESIAKRRSKRGASHTPSQS
ncbi:hypothetical protein CBS101457_000051 [Exobasidium rhododendri]|nr:hypothetical protein CBS101457_000051 [Exobasidium rhododendri]